HRLLMGFLLHTRQSVLVARRLGTRANTPRHPGSLARSALLKPDVVHMVTAAWPLTALAGEGCWQGALLGMTGKGRLGVRPRLNSSMTIVPRLGHWCPPSQP